jgi:TonB-linked SusC/RagA family outer membrane protein
MREKFMNVRRKKQPTQKILLFMKVSLFLVVWSAFSAYAGTNNPMPGSVNLSTEQSKKITGKVTDSSGATLPGVSVVLKGTTNGTTTDVNGVFTLSNIPSNAVLQFSFVGFVTQEVPYKGQTTIDVKLAEEVIGIEGVVVTALGIKREKKALGYSVQDVKADELTQAGSPDVTASLQGKVSGVSISSTGTGVGGSTKITIRGNSSLADNNEPLWIVDGVPYDNSTETGNYQWGGYDRAGGAFDLNPNDIESISVLKGPAAAALYGSRAGNGVIVVTTKKGKESTNLGINYTFNYNVSKVAYSLDLQNKYGQGDNGVYNVNSENSWGAEMKGQSIPAWWNQAQTTTYTAQNNLIKNYFNNAITQSHNVSFSGGNDKGTFRASVGNDRMDGNFNNQVVEKTNFDVVSTYKINKFLDIETKTNYIHTTGEQRPLLGFYSTMAYLYAMPRNIQLSDLYDHRYNEDNLAAGTYTEQNWATPNANHRNVYFQEDQFVNSDKKNRFFGYAQANIKFTDYLKLKIKHGMDYSGTQYKYIYKFPDAIHASYPSMEMDQSQGKEINSEFLLSFNKKYSDFDLGISVGGNRMHSKSEGIWGSSGKFAVSNAYFLSLGTYQQTSNSIWEKEINSFYGFANIGYKDYLFLDLTARNDWSSTLPSNNRSYFYPSVSLSGIVTQMLEKWGVNYNKNVFSYAKLRGSFAQVGKDTNPYQLRMTYDTSTGPYSLLYATVPTKLANINLKPEIATSYEVGTELKFFNNRIGLDFTYYNTVTKNQVLDIPVVISLGYSSKIANVGKIRNQGVELMIPVSIIRNDKFTFDANINLAKNKSKIEVLDPEVSRYEFGALNNGVSVVAIEGDPFGEIYGYGYKRDSNGNKIIGADGLPVKTDSQQVLGKIQPDFTGSLGLNLNYKGIFLASLISFQKGGDIYSLTESMAAYAGTAATTLERSDRVVAGVTENGSANTQSISAQNYWQNGTQPEEYIYDASYIKLKELALGYDLPKPLLNYIPFNAVHSLKVSLVGSNLLYLLKHTPGTTPDGSAMSSNVYSQAIDFAPVPNTRTFGFTVNVGF